MRGLAVQSSALDALLNVLAREREAKKKTMTKTKNAGGGGGGDVDVVADDNETIYAIIDEIKERMVHGQRRGGGVGGGGGCRSGSSQVVVTPSMLGEVVADLSRTGRDAYDESVQLLDAFRTPRLAYDPMRRTFELIDPKSSLLDGEAVDKVRGDII
jgi:hypothetical protein